jgi:hypothetical protein
MRNKNLILNYLFICGVLLLFFNDHYFKFEFPGMLTGKLSDVCGILIFPLLLTYLFPKVKEHSVWITMVLFTYWKSPYSQVALDLYNQYVPIGVSRVIDYSDLLVFVLLPIPYFLLKNDRYTASISIQKVNPMVIVLPSLLVLAATAPRKGGYVVMSKGNLHCYKCTLTIHQNSDTLLSKLGHNGLTFDSVVPFRFKDGSEGMNDAKRLFKQELIIGKDTLRNIDVTLIALKKNKTKVYFNGMDVSEKLTEEKLLNKLRRHYEKLIFEELKSHL